MQLDLRGHPLHTRALSITLAQAGPGRLAAHASLLDLRKRGFVPVGGDLQPSGIVHHMLIDAEVDPAAGTVVRMEAAQPSVAFEASALTRGESCRDVAGAIAALAGAALDAGWSRRLAEAIGGPRGCSHVLTLAQLLGPTLAWALVRDRAVVGAAPRRRAGERLFRRDLVVDGALAADGATLALAVQLTDLHSHPAPAVVPSMDRFAEALEVRALAHVAMGSQTVVELALAERRRGRDTLAAGWHRRDDVAADLVGLGLGRGVSAALVERLGGGADDRPLLDALLALAPALIQVYAAVSDGWPEMALHDGWLVGLGSRPDACWMWRAEGALMAARSPGDPRLFS